MSAPIPTQEQSNLAATIASSIAARIGELLPAIQDHLASGGTARGLTARITFRLGQQGEAPAVAEVEYTLGTGDGEQWLLAPNPATGSLALMNTPGLQPQTAPPMEYQQPAPAPPPQPQPGFFRSPGEAGGGGPLAPRGTLEMPAHGMTLEQPPGISAGAPQTPAQAQSLAQAIAHLPADQQQVILQSAGGKPAEQKPAPRRLQRPMLAGEEGVS